MAGPSLVYETLDENEARLVRDLLQSYGIPVVFSADTLVHSVYPLKIGAVGISVPTRFLEEARSILEAHRSAGSSLEGRSARSYPETRSG